MTISEKILLEKDRHIKKVEELKTSLELEYSLYEKNMDELRKEEEKERLASFGITPETEKIDFSQLKPLPFDDRLKMSEEERSKINQHLEEIVKRDKEMKMNGINIQTGNTESFSTQSPALSQLEMLTGGGSIIMPEYNQEEQQQFFDSEYKGKIR